MKPDHVFLLIRRTGATLVDTGIEVMGGILGSYFGMMIAALMVTVKNGEAAQMQSSMWSGFGFGFMFWALSISFLNRVLIQGISRASIGKKVFKLELISTSHPLTWGTIVGRWAMGFGSLALMGVGYVAAFFDKEGRTFHDKASHTDVVPSFVGSSMSVEYHEAAPLPVKRLPGTVLVFNSRHAPVIDLASIREAAKEAVVAKTHLAIVPSEEAAAGTDQANGTDQATATDDTDSGSQAA